MSQLVGVKRNLWFTEQGRVRRANFPIDGLVLYLPLWHPELTGSPIISKDLNALSCAVTGAVWTSTGRTFDGSDDTINCGVSDVLNLAAGAHTILLWAKTTTTDEKYLYLRWTYPSGYGMAISATQKLQIWAGTDPPGWLAGNSTFNDGLWHLVGYSKNGTAVTVWLDGQADGTPTGGVGLTNPGATAYIASRDGGNCWSGSIGEGWIYNRIVSAVEANHIYSSTKWRYQ